MTAATVKAGLVGVLEAAFASDTLVQVTYGTPGPTTVPDVVAVLDVDARPDGEEETFEMALVVSCYVGGGTGSQQTATDRAHTLLATAKAAIDAAPTLGATARTAALEEDVRTGEAIAYDAVGVPIGRLCELRGTVVAWTGRTLIGSAKAAHYRP